MNKLMLFQGERKGEGSGQLEGISSHASDASSMVADSKEQAEIKIFSSGGQIEVVTPNVVTRNMGEDLS